MISTFCSEAMTKMPYLSYGLLVERPCENRDWNNKGKKGFPVYHLLSRLHFFQQMGLISLKHKI